MESIDSYIDKSIFVDRLLSVLTERELHAFILWSNGYGVDDSAVIMGISPTRIDQLHAQIKTKLLRLK